MARSVRLPIALATLALAAPLALLLFEHDPLREAPRTTSAAAYLPAPSRPLLVSAPPATEETDPVLALAAPRPPTPQTEPVDLVLAPPHAPAPPTPKTTLLFPTWSPWRCGCEVPPPPQPANSAAAANGGLRWLKRHQSPDGSWAPPAAMDCGCCPNASHVPLGLHDQVGATALAVLAFLAQGQTHRFGTYKRMVHKGIRWLKKHQAEAGSWPDAGVPIRDEGLATLALCEAYAISRDFTLKRYAARAVNHCLQVHLPRLAQTPTAESAWVVSALVAAQEAKIELPDDVEERLTRTLPLSDSGDLGRLALTSWIHRRLGRRAAVAGLEGAIWSRIEAGELQHADLETLYLVTLQQFAAGGPRWKRYHPALKDALLRSQRDLGCQDGTWDPVLASSFGRERLVSTVLLAGCLELYYRYERARDD